MNCFGMDRIAARVKTMIPMPHVEKMAVVTGKMSYFQLEQTEIGSALQ